MSKIDDLRLHIEFKMSVRELPTPVGERMLELLANGGTPDYRVLHEAATFTDPPVRCFHTASVEDRDSISANGLLPGDERNWNQYQRVSSQPKGVYVAPDPDLRGVWSHWDSWDVWEVNMEGLTWEHDRLNPGCWVVKSVPVDRLTLAHVGLTW